MTRDPHCWHQSSMDAHHPGELTEFNGRLYCPRCLPIAQKWHKPSEEYEIAAAKARHPSTPRLTAWFNHDPFCDCSSCGFVNAALDEKDDDGEAVLA